jgi:putative FmdB family regulatory protein
MPLFEYKCQECGKNKIELFDIKKNVCETTEFLCPVCRKKTIHKKMISKSNAIFTGTGFHATDYKKK